MKKIISLIVFFALAGCETTYTTNPKLSAAHIEQCKVLGERVVAQDSDFKPVISLSSLVWDELPVIAEDFQDGILTCSLAGSSDDGYAIAYAARSDVLLHQKFTGNKKLSTLEALTEEVAVVEQRLQSLKEAEKLREENEQKQREVKAKQEAEKNALVQFCMDFGKKYADILKLHGMTVGKISVSDSWGSGDSVTCVNSYDGYWDGDKEATEKLQEQHVINKITGEYQTIFR